MATQFRREDLEPALRRAADLVLDFFARLDERRVAPSATREELDAIFAGTLKDMGVGLEQAVGEFEQWVLPNSMTTPHPLYLGLVNSSPLPGGTIGDLLVSTLDNNNGAFHQSPAMTAAEAEVVRAFARMFRMQDASGMLLPGGTAANLHGLLLARARHFPTWRKEGVSAGERPVLYTSRSSHFCIARTAQVMGLGERHAVAVPTVGRGAMDAGWLAERIAQDRAAGHKPFCIVATMGTTGTGALDPLADVAALCEEHGLWLHVDACYGGASALLDELAPKWNGIERADSVAVDPHKWFFAPITAGLVLTRHRDVERAAFDLDASYIPGSDGDAFRRGVPTTRRASGMTVWLMLRAHGLAAVRDAVRSNIALMRRLEQGLEGRGFRVLPGGELSIACARLEPAGRSPEELDELQGRIAREVTARGKAWFSTVVHDGQTWLRFNLVNVHTREEHIDELVDVLADVASS